MHMLGANQLVVLRRMMFGEAITAIGLARVPMDIELFLADAITDPAAAHVNGLGVCLLASLVDN